MKYNSFCAQILFIFFTLFIQINLTAQIDIKSKIDADTYVNYSKSIDLFEKHISPNDVVTLFIPINYAVIDRLTQYKTVFVTKDNNAINSFIAHHSIQKLISEASLRQDIINLSIDRAEIFKSNNTYHFVKNDVMVMLTDKISFEANIEKAIQISPNIIIYFIQSVVKY